MKFLLNSKVEIFSLNLNEENDGSFIKSSQYLGSFFCATKLNLIDNKNYLTLITRDNRVIRGKLEVVYEKQIYSVKEIKQISDGFLKLLCTL